MHSIRLVLWAMNQAVMFQLAILALAGSNKHIYTQFFLKTDVFQQL